MIRFKCPKCGASCRTSHCFDCDIDIPMSQRFDDGTGNDGDAGLDFGILSKRSSYDQSRLSGTSDTRTIRYKCSECGALCRTSHCYDCDIDLPMSSRFDSDVGFVSEHPMGITVSAEDDKRIGLYLTVDRSNKRFKFRGDSNFYSFDDLVNYELCENNETIQIGGIGRAAVGGALFGDAGVAAGAQTGKTHNIVEKLYIRLSLKSVGLKTITFIYSQADKSSFTYKRERKYADAVLSELDLILAENQSAAAQTAAQPTPAPVRQPSQPEKSPALVADELLKLKQLLDMGVLSQEEFDRQKQKLLNG